jgi:hypothetical protein
MVLGDVLARGSWGLDKLASWLVSKQNLQWISQTTTDTSPFTHPPPLSNTSTMAAMTVSGLSM